MKAGRIALFIAGSLAAAPRGRVSGRRRLGPQRQHRLGRLRRHRRPPSPDRHPRPRIRRPRRRHRLRLVHRRRPGAARQRREQQAALHRHRPHRTTSSATWHGVDYDEVTDFDIDPLRLDHRTPRRHQQPRRSCQPDDLGGKRRGNRPSDARLGRRRRRLVGRRHERRRQCRRRCASSPSALTSPT